MSAAPTRILIVDDHPITRQGLKTLLATEPAVEVVGEAKNGAEAVDVARRLKPDVVLMDLVMPDGDGVEATRRILAENGGTRVLVLTSYGSDAKLFPALEAGASGYLIKDSKPDEVLHAIRQVARGESPLSPAAARRVVAGLSGNPSNPRDHDALSDREIDVLREIAHGLSNEEIADKLCISPATVRTHVSHVLSKLQLTRRTQAMLYALRHGIADLDD